MAFPVPPVSKSHRAPEGFSLGGWPHGANGAQPTAPESVTRSDGDDAGVPRGERDSAQREAQLAAVRDALERNDKMLEELLRRRSQLQLVYAQLRLGLSSAPPSD